MNVSPLNLLTLSLGFLCSSCEMKGSHLGNSFFLGLLWAEVFPQLFLSVWFFPSVSSSSSVFQVWSQYPFFLMTVLT